jgi:invasion protein IalB
MDRRRNDRGVSTGRLKSAMTVLRVRARFAERALSGRRFGVFGRREVGLGILVKLAKASNTAVAALAVMMVPPAAAAQPARAAPAPQAATPGSAPGMPRFIYTPWAKFCGKSKDAQAKQVCFTGKDARTEAGQPLVAAALIEPEGESNRLFRITLPNPLQLQYGTRVIVDQQPPMTAGIQGADYGRTGRRCADQKHLPIIKNIFKLNGCYRASIAKETLLNDESLNLRPGNTLVVDINRRCNALGDCFVDAGCAKHRDNILPN